MPIWSVEDGLIVSKQAEVTVAYRIDLPEVFSLGAEALEALHASWVKAMRLLPEGCIVHKQDWYYDAAYEPEFGAGDRDMTDRASMRHFVARPTLAHRSYLFVTMALGPRKRASALTSTFTKANVIPREISEPGAIDRFVSTVEQMVNTLGDEPNVSLHRLTDDELAGTPTHAGVIEQYMTLSEIDAPILRDVSLEDGLTIGSRKCKLLTIATADNLPGYITAGKPAGGYSHDRAPLYITTGNVFGLYCPVPHIYNQYFRIANDKELISTLEGRQSRMTSLAPYSRPNAVFAEQIDGFLDELTETGRQVLQCHANLLVYGDTDEDLKRSMSAALGAFSRANITPREEIHALGSIWWAGIPGNAGDLPSEEYFHTFAPQAACLLALETNYASSSSPSGIRFVDRLTGYPVDVDLSVRPYEQGLISNFNKFILGPSGTGKSFLTNHLVHNYYKQNTHVVIVDVGGSYSGTCEYVGGLYYQYSETDPISFNPFRVPGDGSFNIEKREALKTIIITLWKTEGETLSRTEYGGVSGALRSYYQAIDAAAADPTADPIEPSFNTFYEFVRDKFSGELEERGVRDEEFNVSNFLFALEPFYRGGEFDYLLNAEEDLDLLDEPFIVFELDNVTSHPILFPIVTLVVMDVFITKMRKLPGDTRKILCIEEAWKAISKGEMAHFTKYLFKTARKYLAEAWVVTQEVNDILSSDIVKEAIISNADCKILMDQRKFANRFDDIAALLGLSDSDIAQVMSVGNTPDGGRKFKDCFIGLGPEYANVFGLEVPLEEYLIYTTHAPEKAAVQAAADRAGDYALGVQNLASELRADPNRLRGVIAAADEAEAEREGELGAELAIAKREREAKVADRRRGRSRRVEPTTFEEVDRESAAA